MTNFDGLVLLLEAGTDTAPVPTYLLAALLLALGPDPTRQRAMRLLAADPEDEAAVADFRAYIER